MKSAPNVNAVGDRRDASVFDLHNNSVAIVHIHDQSGNSNVKGNGNGKGKGNGVREQQEQRSPERMVRKKHQPLIKSTRPKKSFKSRKTCKYFVDRALKQQGMIIL